jgi:sugar phosphate isomerase/epimerase
MPLWTRRQALAGLTSSLLVGAAGAAPLANGSPVCAFVKFVQELPFDRLADELARMGFDGIEATVRPKGIVLPERVEDDLPRLVEALRRRGLSITVMASDVNDVNQPHTEKVLTTAAKLGVTHYRMRYYRYASDRGLLPQLDEFRSRLADLVALNKQLGLTAVYQNHSGPRNVGATVWDLHALLRNFSAEQVGIAFDIRHATVEAGLSWPTLLRLMQPHLAAVYVKDFVWDGRRPRNVPLGTGRIDPTFFHLLRRMEYSGPVSLHVEYLHDGGVEKNLAALKTDLATLRRLMAGDVPK